MLVVITSLFLFSCKKDVGPAGPKGDTGNANVTQINFGAKTITLNQPLELTLPGITKEIADKSLILCYGLSSNLWYQIPGYGYLGAREYRIFIGYTALNAVLTVKMATGSGSESFDAFRVIVIPANLAVTGKNGMVMPDLSDYNAVKTFFNLP